MSRFMMVLLMFVSSISFADVPVRVTGSGNDPVTARHDAYRKAVEYKVGSILLSEVKITNNDLLKNDILVYSAGYVDDYVIISEYDGKSIVLDVYVSKSRLADRIIASSDTNRFDGARHSLQLDTFQQQKELSFRYVNMILKDYPYHGLHIYYSGYEIYRDNKNQNILRIPYTISWNNGYLSSTKEMLDTLKDKKGSIRGHGNANIVFVPRRDTTILETTITSSRKHYVFDNNEYMLLMKNYFHDLKHKAYVKLEMFDINGNVLRSYCKLVITRFVDTTQHHKFLIFYEKQKEIDTFELIINFPTENIYEYKMSLVKSSNC